MKKENQKTKLKNWSNEIARDSLAIGSIPMFIIVTARAGIGNYYQYVYEILLAGLILFFFHIFSVYLIKIKSQNHIARAIILFIFTSLLYNDVKFTIFIFFLLIIIFVSLFYLKYNKKQILYGILLGLLSSLVSYLILNYLLK